jgi:hypothetical protein
MKEPDMSFNPGVQAAQQAAQAVRQAAQGAAAAHYYRTRIGEAQAVPARRRSHPGNFIGALFGGIFVLLFLVAFFGGLIFIIVNAVDMSSGR